MEQSVSGNFHAEISKQVCLKSSMDKALSPFSELQRKFTGKPAVITDEKTYTFDEFAESIRGAIARLKFAGIREGDRVGIFLPNCYEYLVLLAALWHLRAVACPVSIRLPSNTVVPLLEKIACRKIVMRLDRPIAPPPSSAQLFNISVLVPRISPPVRTPPLNKISLGQEATIIFTSGSTETPKAVLHTFGNHYYNALGSNQHIPFKPGDRWILSLPLYHVGGLGVFFRALVGGGAIVIAPENLRLIRAIKKFKITHTSLVPAQLYRMDYPPHNLTILSKLKCILLGGSAIPGTLVQRAQRFALPLFKTYGLTEMASQVTVSVNGNPDKHIILPYRKLKIAPDGEVLVRGATLFKGYVSAEKTHLPLNSDGWFQTGDIGTFSQSILTITGRKDNMFISGGENIYPEEIEQSLCALEGVEDAVVIPVQNKQFGLRPVAFLKINSRGQASLERFRKQLSAQIPGFKVPDEFYRWPDELPAEESLKTNRTIFARFLKDKKLAL